MAYITPPLRATGDLITPAIWNQDVRDNWIVYETHGHGGTTASGGAALGNLTHVTYTDAAAPAAPGAGLTRLYGTSGEVRFRAGAAGADTPLLAGGTSWAVIYTNASGQGTLLAIGGDDRILGSRGPSSAPAWDDAPARRYANHLMLMGI